MGGSFSGLLECWKSGLADPLQAQQLPETLVLFWIVFALLCFSMFFCLKTYRKEIAVLYE
jgi:hypothetical protein